jgi:hypothetical protein
MAACQGAARCGVNPGNHSVCENRQGMGITLQAEPGAPQSF